MTQNSVSAISSSPWTGLGTQTYNVLTTGTYTCQVFATIPWDTTNTTAALANPASVTVETVTLVADSGGSLNSTYFNFSTAGDTSLYYVWYNINSAGVDPAPAGRTGIQVAGATNATGTTLATATAAAINAVTGNGAGATGTVVAKSAVAILTLGDTQIGTKTAAANGTASPGFTYATTAAGSYGTLASGLNIQIRNNGTTVQTVANPTQSQASMYCTQTMACTAGTTITMVAASTAAADQTPNAVHGIMNVFAGPL